MTDHPEPTREPGARVYTIWLCGDCGAGPQEPSKGGWVCGECGASNRTGYLDQAKVVRASDPTPDRVAEDEARSFGLHPQRQRAHQFPLAPIPDPPNTRPGKQWYACERCGCSFSEAHPTQTGNTTPCEPAPSDRVAACSTCGGSQASHYRDRGVLCPDSFHETARPDRVAEGTRCDPNDLAKVKGYVSGEPNPAMPSSPSESTFAALIRIVAAYEPAPSGVAESAEQSRVSSDALGALREIAQNFYDDGDWGYFQAMQDAIVALEPAPTEQTGGEE